MERKNNRIETVQQEIWKLFKSLSEKYGKWETWSDFITLSACSLCASDIAERKREYSKITKRYKAGDIEQFFQMFALTVEALECNPNQDFLGDLFMRFDLSDTWKGQFFTAYEICRAMSAITIGDLTTQLETKPWISVNDPACGAGGLLIAFAQECLQRKINYQQSVLFTAQDVDRTAALMCFIQLSLLGCPGYVVVGNTLTNPIVGPSVLLPIKQDGQEIWYTPMMHTEIWQWRITIERMKCGDNVEP